MGSRTEVVRVRYITADGLVSDTVERLAFYGATPQQYIERPVTLSLSLVTEPVEPSVDIRLVRRQYELRSYDGWPTVTRAVYEEVVR